MPTKLSRPRAEGGLALADPAPARGSAVKVAHSPPKTGAVWRLDGDLGRNAREMEERGKEKAEMALIRECLYGEG